MTNKEIGELFGELASLMELHGENEFKTRVYSNAYLVLKKMDIPLLECSKEELSKYPGLNKAVIEKLTELAETNKIQALEQLRAATPEGVRKMFKIKGIGPKKVQVFWKQLNIESLGELLYACKENRLIQIKGFGFKIQDDIIKSIEYFQSGQDSFLLPKLLKEAEALIEALKFLNPGLNPVLCGDIRRLSPVADKIEIICDHTIQNFPESFHILTQQDDQLSGSWNEFIKCNIYISSSGNFGTHLLQYTSGSDEFKEYVHLNEPISASTEETYFDLIRKAYIPPECRDLKDFQNFDEKRLIEEKDIRGVIHTHSTYSDGLYDIRSIANECIRLGYSYLVLSDHSKTAVYANGLSIERVEMQWREVDQLNQQLSPFCIFKSIESDILADGSLDYPDDVLQGFDLVIASIHSNLTMDLDKAMTRLIKAIENPYTSILGHLTGRLLLSRRGYPVDHQKIIDCCAANAVSIELNANPVRLDIDWKWIPYAQEKGVLLSINPDAHNLLGIQDIQFGVMAARKGGLYKENCLNAMNLDAFKCWQNVKKSN